LITILQPIFSDVAGQPVETGTYICSPPSHVCTNGFGISVDAFVRTSNEFGAFLTLRFYFEIGTYPRDPIPDRIFFVSSSGDNFDSSELWIHDAFPCYVASLTKVGGWFVSSHEFHAVVDYELWNFPDSPRDCSQEPQNCAASFEFVGMIMPVPVDNSTWGSIKSLYR